MAKEKDNKIPNFAEYERKRLLDLARQARKAVLKLKKTEESGNRTEGNAGDVLDDAEKKAKEQGTLKTVWGVFQEAWNKTGKDFKKSVRFKMGESVFAGFMVRAARRQSFLALRFWRLLAKGCLTFAGLRQKWRRLF